MDFIARLEELKLGKGQAAVTWLGQAGFIVKLSNNTITAIDPYLTHCAEREFGFKRLAASILEPEQFRADILITSHEHLDHFDIDAMPMLAENTRKKIICSPSAAELCRKIDTSVSKLLSLSRGNQTTIDGLTITAVYADHGDLAPDSIGVLLDAGGFTLYYASDTAYRPEENAASLGCEPDVAILPINGMFGNLDAEQAVRLAERLRAKWIIPCHFWTFREHNGEKGDPLTFEKTMKTKYANGIPVFLTPGEIKIIEKEV
jgi:L-ascorbate 6-phosphate lactonase